MRRKSDSEGSTNRRNFSTATKLIEGVKTDDSRSMLTKYYTLLKDNTPTPEEKIQQKSREYMLMKSKKNIYFQTVEICKGEANKKGRRSTSQEKT